MLAKHNQSHTSTGNQEQPWLARKDWARGEARSQEGKAVLIFWLFTLIWNGLTSPLWIAFRDKTHKFPDALFMLVFPAVGLFLLIASIYQTLRWGKFGTSIFKMLSLPGTVGGNLSGVIQIGKKIIPEDGFHLILRNLQYVTTGSGKQRRTTEEVLWENTKTLRSEMLQEDPRRTGIPVFFQIPTDAAPTNKSLKVFWRLEATAKVAGIDYKSTFEVPVFRVANAPEGKISENEFSERYLSQESPAQTLGRQGIRVEDAAGAGTTFSYANARHSAPMITAFLFFLIFGGISAAIWKAGGFALLLGIVTFPIALIGLWGLSESIFKSIQVTAHVDGIRIATRRLFFTSNRFIPIHQIRSINSHPAMRINHVAYYEIRVSIESETRMRQQRIVAGVGIKGDTEAQWVVDKMYSALNLTN